MEATISYLLMPEKHINSNPEINDYALCWGNSSKEFTIII